MDFIYIARMVDEVKKGLESSGGLSAEELAKKVAAEETAAVTKDTTGKTKKLEAEVTATGELSGLEENIIAGGEEAAGAQKIEAENTVAAVAKTPEQKEAEKELNIIIKENTTKFKKLRKQIDGMSGTEKNGNTLDMLKGTLDEIINAFLADGITISSEYVVDIPDTVLGSKDQKETISQLLKNAQLMKLEMDDREQVILRLELAKTAVLDYEGDPKNDDKRKIAREAIKEVSLLADKISKYSYDDKLVNPASVPNCADLRTRLESCLAKYGYTKVTTTSKTGEEVVISTSVEGHTDKDLARNVAKLDASFEGLLPRGSIHDIQATLFGGVGDMAYPTTMQGITATRGKAGKKYAKKYQKLYHNHHLGKSKKSEASYLSAVTKIVEKSGDATFGNIRQMKKFSMHMRGLAKKEKSKLKHADVALKCAIERATSRHQLRRSMDISDHLLQMESRGPEHHHGLPAYDAGGMWETQAGKDIIMFAHSTYGEDRHDKISGVLGSKEFRGYTQPPHIAAGVMYPTRGIESYLAEDARKNKEAEAYIEDGRQYLLPGSPAVALTRYIYDMNKVNPDGEKNDIVSPRLATFLMERWFKTGAEGYDIIAGLQGLGKSKEEAQGIAHQILKDSFTGNGGWRSEMRNEYRDLADNYRERRGNREGRDYSGKGMADIKDKDKYEMRGLAAVNATAGVYCNNDKEKAMARRRFSQVREKGTEAWNPVPGVRGGLGNAIVGEQMSRMLDDIDGRGDGGIKERYVDALVTDGHFVGLLDGAEATFNKLAKDANLSTATANKIGKLAKISMGVGVFVGGIKLLKRAWNGRKGKGDNTTFLARLGRIGLIAGAGYVAGEEVKSLISGGKFGNKGFGKTFMGRFGKEPKYESTEGFTAKDTLGFVFGGMATGDVIDMFSPNKNGTFALSKNALSILKKGNPGANDAYFESINAMLKDSDSDLNMFLTEGLGSVGINKDSYKNVRARFGSKNFMEYIESYTISSHLMGELEDLGLDEAATGDYIDALVGASPEEAEVIKSRIEEMKLHTSYYPAMRAKMTHILKYRPDMVAAASGISAIQADLLAGLDSANVSAYDNMMKEYVTGVKGTTTNGFDINSTFDGFLDTLNNEVYKGDATMRTYLGHENGFTNIDTDFNTGSVESVKLTHTNKDRYMHRASSGVPGENYTERLLDIGGKEVFLGLEEGTNKVGGGKDSTLVLRVPEGTGWKKVNVTKWNNKPLNIKGMGRTSTVVPVNDPSGKQKIDASGKPVTRTEQMFEMDAFGREDPVSGIASTAYEKRPMFSVNFLEELVNAATSGKTEVTLYKSQHVETTPANLAGVKDEFKISFADGKQSRP